MKNISIYLLVAAGILQGCAGTVSPQGKGTRQLLEGSKQLSVTSEQCSRGLGIVRLYKDTLDGNKTRFNAKMGMTSKPIEGKFNVYNLLDENHPALLQKGERKQAKAEVDGSRNSFVIKLSSENADKTATTSDKRLLKDSDGTVVKVNDEISIRYNSKAKYYENWGVVEHAALSEVDNNTKDQDVLHSVKVKVNDNANFVALQLPDSLDAPELDGSLEKLFSQEIGKSLEIKVNPKKNETATMIYVQFTNGQKGKDNATYNYVVDESGDGTIPVPTKGIKPGTYIMNIFRSSILPVPVGDEAGGSVCIEVGSGIMGRVAFKAPEKKK